MRPLQTQQDWAAANIPGRSGYGADPTHGLLAALVQGAARTQDDELLAMLLPALLQSMQPEDTWARDLERERFELERDATLIDAYNIARETGDPRANEIWNTITEGRGFEPSAGEGYHRGVGGQYQNYLDKFYGGEMNLTPEDYDFYKSMATADEDAIRKFQEDKAYGGAAWGRGPRDIKGTNMFTDLFTPEFWSLGRRGETYAREQAGFPR